MQLGGSGVGNMLTVAGNYVGQNATIALNTTLAGDGAPSDKLIVSGGAASGTSTLKVTNVGGAGARTVTDGIQVVQAINGATTRAGAFSLSGGSVSAGAYTYFLAKGGEATGTGDSWYLRNTVPPKPQPPVVARSADAAGRAADHAGRGHAGIDRRSRRQRGNGRQS